MSNKFRNASGTRYLKQIFFEMAVGNKDAVVYTLKDHDHKGYPSLYRLYMEGGDLTEWEFANNYLDGWEHWQMLCNCNWFKEYVERWREELELKVMASALKNLQTDAAAQTKTSITSNKFLLDRGWKPKETKVPVGRPTKEKILRKAKEIALEEMEIDEDHKRMMQ